MDRESRRLAFLSVAATLIVAGIGVLVTVSSREGRWIGGALISAGIILVVGTYAQDSFTRRREARPPRPSLPRGYEFVSYKVRPYQFDQRTPYVAELRFKPRCKIQPVRLEVVCSDLIQSAAAVMEDSREGQLFEGYGFQTTVADERAYFGFSQPPTEPRFVFIVEIRSAQPVRVLRLRAPSDGALEDQPHESVRS